MIPQQFLRRDNLQRTILRIPACIDVTLCSCFLFFMSKITCVVVVDNVFH